MDLGVFLRIDSRESPRFELRSARPSKILVSGADSLFNLWGRKRRQKVHGATFVFTCVVRDLVRTLAPEAQKTFCPTSFGIPIAPQRIQNPPTPKLLEIIQNFPILPTPGLSWKLPKNCSIIHKGAIFFVILQCHQHQTFTIQKNPARNSFRKNYKRYFPALIQNLATLVWFLCNIHAIARGAHGSSQKKSRCRNEFP